MAICSASVSASDFKLDVFYGGLLKFGKLAILAAICGSIGISVPVVAAVEDKELLV